MDDPNDMEAVAARRLWCDGDACSDAEGGGLKDQVDAAVSTTGHRAIVGHAEDAVGGGCQGAYDRLSREELGECGS